ncbi:MAG: hypothetical protein M3Q19_15735 [Pseudomonadota bacterium]|nr:hypothetical protein [Pseudomonadota bacterium]
MINQIRMSHLFGIAGSLLIAAPAAASTQGSFGATSTGSLTINASVPGRVRISGLSDVAFTNADPSVNATNAQNVCVWSNTSTRGYSITATGSGAAGAFTLASGALPVVPYTVQWASSSGQTSGTSLTATTALTGQTSTATNSDCSAGPAASASLVVSIGSATLQGMDAGVTYDGTLTLLVAPE